MLAGHAGDTELALWASRVLYIDGCCLEGVQGGDVGEGVGAFVGEVRVGVWGGDDGEITAEGGFYFLVEVVSVPVRLCLIYASI